MYVVEAAAAIVAMAEKAIETAETATTLALMVLALADSLSLWARKTDTLAAL